MYIEEAWKKFAQKVNFQKIKLIKLFLFGLFSMTHNIEFLLICTPMACNFITYQVVISANTKTSFLQHN